MKAVLLKISKAFDRVWHRGPIAKFEALELKGICLTGLF